MAKDALKKAGRLRQAVETWDCTARLARAWITPPDQAPYRPYIVLIASHTGKVVGSQVIENKPTPDQVLEILAGAMGRPVLGSGGKRRPTTVHIDDETLAEALAPKLREIGVRCRYQRALPEVEEALRSFERFRARGEPILGLSKSPGVTPYLVNGVFEAAALFYREAPWRWIDDARPIEVRYPADGRPRYAVVMGHGGYTYGLAVYNSTDVLRETYSGGPPEKLIERGEWTSLLFGGITETPFDDLDDIEKYGWPVAGEEAYPLPLRVSRSGNIFRPGKSELLWLEAALLAIPPFVCEHMQADGGFCHPAEATLTIKVADGEDSVYLRYPVPGFEVPHEEDWAAEEEEWSAEIEAAFRRNVELLRVFVQWLSDQGLAVSTARRHLDKVQFFANAYMAVDGGSSGVSRPADQADQSDIEEYLSDWFLEEAWWVSEGTVRASIAALKKFYACLRETGQMPAEGANEILELLKANRGRYLALGREYESVPVWLPSEE